MFFPFPGLSVESDHRRFASRSSLASSAAGHRHANGNGDLGPYESLVWEHETDENARREMALGKRIGFYRFKSELGTGNFSKVKLAINLLTRGRKREREIEGERQRKRKRERERERVRPDSGCCVTDLN
jgi:hypothetical protein